VSIGAARRGIAGTSEVLVSQTVKDLVAGSGFDFEDRGEHVLKGIRGAWRVFAVH
jgi:class 3 adenylate cyclase